MKIIGTIAGVMLFAFKSFSMGLPDALLLNTFTWLSWPEAAAASTTCQKFNNARKKRNQFKVVKFDQVTIPNGSKFVCFNSEQSFCMIHEEIETGHLLLLTIDGDDLLTSVIPMASDLRDGQFVSHRKGIFYAHEYSVDILDEKDGSIKPWVRMAQKTIKIYCIGDHMVFQRDQDVYVMSTVEDEERGVHLSSVNLVAGLEKHIWIFGDKEPCVLVSCPNFAVFGTSRGPYFEEFDNLPVKIAASSKKLMVTCHEDMESSSLKFFKTFYFGKPNADVHIRYTKTKKMSLSLPAMASVRQLFLKGPLLFVMATSENCWSLFAFNVDKDQLIHQQNFELAMSEVYSAGNNIFGVVKTCDAAGREHLNVIAIAISEEFQKSYSLAAFPPSNGLKRLK